VVERARFRCFLCACNCARGTKLHIRLFVPSLLHSPPRQVPHFISCGPQINKNMSLTPTSRRDETTHYSAFFCRAGDAVGGPVETGASLLRRTNPAHPSETVYTMEQGTAVHVDRAVAAAASARRAWAGLATLERNRILRTAVAAVMAQKERIAGLLLRETGRPLPFCFAEVDMIPGYFEAAMAQALTVRGDCNRSFTPGEMTLVTYEPVGVCACILPWNWPVMLLAQKIAPALAAGNVVIVKPSECVPVDARAAGAARCRWWCPRCCFSSQKY
jgi:delta 1-pyrroline-5-carboxylate dehydrogenase